MNTRILSVCATILLAASASLSAEKSSPTAQSASAVDAQKTKSNSLEFERMKTLVGSWQGKTDMGQGPIDLTMQYRLLAGGSVLEERCFAGTPNEMLTMYYEKDGKLAMTHYCVQGNRPGMLLKASDSKTLKFDFDETCGLNAATENHMHALTITFDDANTITTSCKAIIGGKETEEKPTTLKRVKS